MRSNGFQILLFVQLSYLCSINLNGSVYQGQLKDPSAETTVTVFEVPGVIEGQTSKVRIRTLGKSGGIGLSAPEIRGSPTPNKTIVPSGGFVPVIKLYDAEGALIAEESGIIRSTFGPLPTDANMDLNLIPGKYTLKISVYGNSFLDPQGNLGNENWAVEIITLRDLLSNTVSEPLMAGSEISTNATFAVAEAIPLPLGFSGRFPDAIAEFGGFDHFNWYQTIDAINPNTNCRGTGPDPEPGGNCSGLTEKAWYSALASLAKLAPEEYGQVFSDLASGLRADEAIWYWDETLIGTRESFYVDNNTALKSLQFTDEPSGFSVGTVIEFSTYLVGVKSDGNGVFFAEPHFRGTAFKWKYTQTTEQVGQVDGVQFFQDTGEGFFVPDVGGSVEFLGVVSEAEWLAALPELEAQGFDVVGLPDEQSGPSFYGPYEVQPDGFCDTTPWMGWLFVETAPWVWSSDMNHWLYCFGENITGSGAWVYWPN